MGWGWPMGRRWVGGVAALLLGGALASSGVAPAAGQAALPPSPPRPLSFLHAGAVAGPANLRQVVDEQGREVLLKGVNVDGIADYWQQPPALPTPYPIDPSQYRAGKCPPDDHAVEGVMVCDFDFAQMRVLGYDAIRLNLSWSLLEPLPGQIDTTYIDRIAQVVGWAKAQGIYVILDMHQDAWSKFVYTHPGDNCAALGPGWGAVRGYDGAPRWASQYVGPACAFHGVREIDPAVDQCFKKFYLDAAAPDGVGLQEHYAHAMLLPAEDDNAPPLSPRTDRRRKKRTSHNPSASSL